MNRRKLLALLMLWITVLTGCRVKSQEGYLVVNRISVTTEQSGLLTRREFSRPEHMRQILGMFRLLGQKSTPQTDPEQIVAKTYRIVLHYADGSSRIICTKEDRYIREGTAPWKQVSAEGIYHLHLLLQNLPSEDQVRLIPRYIPTKADAFQSAFFTV